MNRIKKTPIFIFLVRNRFLLLLSFIFLIGTVFRLYNFPFRYSLGEETVRDAVIGIEGARQLQAPLTGSFSSLGPFTFGPWYAYQLILFSIFVPSVYAPWIYLSVISVLYILILYQIGLYLKDKVFGLMLAFIVAISPAQIISATHLTSHNNTNLFAALSILLFLRILLRNGSYWWGFLLGICIGIGMNLHFQMAGLMLLPVILLFTQRDRKLYLPAALGGVMVAFIPMLFFELNNHWFNTRNIIDYLLYERQKIYVPNRWLTYVLEFWPSFWADAIGVPMWAALAIIVGFLVTTLAAIRKRKLTLPFFCLFLVFGICFIGLRYYWGPRFFGYLNFLRPFVFIATAYTIYQVSIIKPKHFGYSFAFVLIVGIFYLSLPRNLSQLSPDPLSIQAYHAVNIAIKRYPNQKFKLFVCSDIYRTSYNSSAYAIVFALEKEKKYSSKGLSLGLKSECLQPSDNASVSAFPLIDPIGLLDYSTISAKKLKKAGWEPVAFSSLYDTYANWWFKKKY